MKQNRPNENDWGNNEKILIDINEVWVSDISKIDNGKCDASEMDNRMVNASEMGDKWFNAMRSVVRIIKSSNNLNLIHSILISSFVHHHLMVYFRKSISFTPKLQLRYKTPICKAHNVH